MTLISGIELVTIDPRRMYYKDGNGKGFHIKTKLMMCDRDGNRVVLTQQHPDPVIVEMIPMYGDHDRTPADHTLLTTYPHMCGWMDSTSYVCAYRFNDISKNHRGVRFSVQFNVNGLPGRDELQCMSVPITMMSKPPVVNKRKDQILEIVQALEWSGDTNKCPLCTGTPSYGHYKDCRIGHVLRRTAGGQKPIL
jgi:hypothetical protein